MVFTAFCGCALWCALCVHYSVHCAKHAVFACRGLFSSRRLQLCFFRGMRRHKRIHTDMCRYCFMESCEFIHASIAIFRSRHAAKTCERRTSRQAVCLGQKKKTTCGQTVGGKNRAPLSAPDERNPHSLFNIEELQRC